MRRHHAPKRFRLRPTDPPEVEFHKTVAEYLDWVLMPPTMWTTFPAGWGELPVTTAARLKACGLKPGFPDILIWRADGASMGLELKKVGKKPTTVQLQTHARLERINVAVYVCETLEEVTAALLDFLLPLRGVRINGNNDAKARRSSQPAESARSEATSETLTGGH